MKTDSLPFRALTRFHRSLLLTLAVFLGACSNGDQAARFGPLPTDAVVLVIGDSLAAGTGAPRGSGWPEGLAQRTGWQVINGGIPGDTSADALRRLDGLIAQHQPQAIIIAIGGNDFLRNVPSDVTRDNIENMIRQSRTAAEHVGIVAIPAKPTGVGLLGSLSDHGMYADLAEANSLALVPAVISDVLSRDTLRADRIHANAKGYETIADGVAKALAQQGWLVR